MEVENTSNEKMEKDEDTAYDEVLDDLVGLTDKYVTNSVIKEIFMQKLRQLRRLIGPVNEEEEDW
jgi:hypothetical protein